MNQRIFLHINEENSNHSIINDLKRHVVSDLNFQCYVISSPLLENFEYDYSDSAFVILIPKKKLVFVDLADDDDLFEQYVEDFLDDLSSLSSKYNYKKHIGRLREWEKDNILLIKSKNYRDINSLLTQINIDDSKSQRISDLLISLLIGSINDIDKIGADVPMTILEKVKKNIILFDGEQTRFIYQDFTNKTVVIQGLSGTGKTELLLHKLKDLYLNKNSPKIFFTCHNIALANTLKERVPSFFNFMKVEKQIEWNKKLWLDRAWGSKADRNSGIYSYICSYYGIPFMRWSTITNYKIIFTAALEQLNKIPDEEFEYAFDYVLVDERQDFPDVFFKVVEKITRHKVFIAGDIFQDIFESSKDDVLNVDVILNKCYRTDPKTLMFAHSVGLGLFEKRKWNWFSDDEWKAFGYDIQRFSNNEIHFTRSPIRRFEDVEDNNILGTKIIKTTHTNDVIKLIQSIKDSDPNLTPNDIAIIILDDNKKIYEYIEALAIHINKKIGWTINRAYESKIKVENTIYVSNPNNVKGLEFPFVICLTGQIKDDYKYRNILYTMLTRSFLNSYLLVTKPEKLDNLEEGLKIINEHNYIKTYEPTKLEQAEIKNQLVSFLMKPNISYKEFLDKLFEEEEIEIDIRSLLEEALLNSRIEKFDEENTRVFIRANKNFY
ncbi:AAA family ATPase [Sphingobacterium kyonggiense]|uniref:DNA 3'-5' helicase II n=1 Tax=Sphingobacterium kyonggiense TaxID=714075 RepID=A0ABP7Z213_9SPHI